MLSDFASLIWASKEYYKQNTPDIEHVHSEVFHYAFILSGNAKVLIGKEMVPVNENTLYMSSPGMEHNFVATSSTGLFTIEFKFYMKSGDYEQALRNDTKRIYECTPQARYVIGNIIEEGIVKKKYYENIVNLHLCELIFILLRDVCDEYAKVVRSKQQKPFDVYEFALLKKDIEGNHNVHPLNNLILYMRENLDKEISLDDLSQSVNISKGHLIELFKKEYNITPIKYLNRIRISKAKELLSSSSYNINQIAEKTGFQDSRYFSRIFRKLEGITPSEYIDKYRSNLYIFMHGDEIPF
jgi:AraC-like DNA-binding protein